MKFVKSSKKGLTLIELLIVLAMVAMIGTGVYKTLSSGISIYNWFFTNAPQNDAEIFLEKISYDLKNIFPGSIAVFYGTSDKISFFIHNTDYILDDKKELAGRNTDEEQALYSIEYRYDTKSNTILRKTYQFVTGKLKTESIVLKNVKKLNFKFCTMDSITKELGEFVPATGNYPAAVKVSVEMDLNSKDTSSYDKIIEIPVNLF